MSSKDSEPPDAQRRLPREPDQGTDPGRARPFESLYRNPDGLRPDSHRTTARHYEPSLSPPDEQPPGDTYHWLYRTEPEPEVTAPTEPAAEGDPGPELEGPPTEATSIPEIDHATSLLPPDPPAEPDETALPDTGQLSRVEPPAGRQGRRVWPVIVLALLLVAAGVAIALTSGERSSNGANGVVPSTVANPSGAVGSASSDVPSAAPSPSGSVSVAPTASDSTEPYAGGVVPVSTTKVSVDCQARPSTDGEGQPVRYDAKQLTDGNASTAWRCEGDGEGRTLVFSFPTGTRIAELGLINGYAKSDPKTRADRYGEYRRILAVKWAFANGFTVSQVLRDNDRSPQTLRIPVQVGEQVRLTIVKSSKPGGKAKSRDAVLISETTFGAPQG